MLIDTTAGSGRTRLVGMCCIIAALAASISALASSTEPVVRSRDANTSTHSPPDATHPIYYPVLASGADASDLNLSVTPELLLRDFMLRHTAMDYPGAAEAALRLIHAAPDYPEGHYNYACALSRMQRIDESFAALEKAIQCGWRDLRHMNMDPDLKNVRANAARFESLVSQLKQLAELEKISVGPPRTDPWNVVVSDLEQNIPTLMKRYHVPGLSVALLHEGEIVWSHSYGIADRRTQNPLRDSDKFRLHGPLHLLALVAAANSDNQGELLGTLLAHAAELQADHAQARNQAPRRNHGDRQAIPVNIRRSSSSSHDAAELETASSITGSNTFHAMLLLLETSAGDSFRNLCTRSVFAPLGMNASVIQPMKAQAECEIIGHSRLGSPMSQQIAENNENRIELLTTARDLAKLVQLMVKDSSAPGIDLPLVTAAQQAISTFRSVQTTLSHPLQLAIAFPSDRADTRVQIADVNLGIGCLMRWHPDQGSGLVILFNSATGMPAAERLAQLALGGN